MNEIIELNLLREVANNPRVSTTEQVEIYKNILQRFGNIIPVIIDENNYVISDYAKVKAAIELGIKEINCIRINNLSENEIQTIRIAETRAIELGKWDYQKLFDELSKIGEDFKLTGFDLDEILEQLPAEVLDINGIDEIDVPEIQEETFTKQQDIWLLGNHRLMCGDSTKLEDVKKIKNDNMNSENFYSFLLAFYKNAYEVMRAGAGFYIFHADSETKAFRGALADAGFKISQCLIWVKNQFILSRQDYNWKHEPCLYGWKEGVKHFFIRNFTQDTIQEIYSKTENMSKKELQETLKNILEEYTTIIRENKPLRNDIHPTMKPIKLISKLIHNSSKENWNILDLFGGSGSTLIAAEQLKRKSFLMEFDEKYADVIVKRYAEMGKENIKLLRNGKTYNWNEVKSELYAGDVT